MKKKKKRREKKKEAIEIQRQSDKLLLATASGPGNLIPPQQKER